MLWSKREQEIFLAINAIVLYYLKNLNQGVVFLLYCAFNGFKKKKKKAGVKSPPPTNAHIHQEETPAQIICRVLSWKQKMVQWWRFTTCPIAMEVGRQGRLWGGMRERGGSPVQQANDSPARASGEPKMSGGESWAPSGQASPPSLLSRTAMLFVMVPLERAVSRIFNAKWAKIRRFLPIQWIDFLLWSVQGPIINVYLFLMGVYETVHIIWALWMCMPVTVSLFMWVM